MGSRPPGQLESCLDELVANQRKVYEVVDGLVKSQESLSSSIGDIFARVDGIHQAVCLNEEAMRRHTSDMTYRSKARKSDNPVIETASLDGDVESPTSVIPRSSCRASLRQIDTSGASDCASSVRGSSDGGMETPSLWLAPSSAIRHRFIAPALPFDWPESLLLPEFARTQAGEISPDNVCNTMSRIRSLTTNNNKPGGVHHSGTSTSQQEVNQDRCVINPTSYSHIILDVFSLAVLFHDLTIIPFILAWGIPIEGAINVLAFSSVVFWTLDIVRSFHTGFYRKGTLVLVLSQVRMNYFRTWFWPDVLVVLCDWTSMLIQSVLTDDTRSSSIKMLRLAKLGRLLRIFSMLRMLRFLRVIEDYVEGNLSETSRLALRVMRICCGVVWCNHLLACAWYGIGRTADTDTGVSWIDLHLQVGDVLISYRDAARMFQYTSSFHWCVAQVTLGSIDIIATNSSERTFNIICLLVGLLLGSSLISSLSASMVNYQMTERDNNEKLKTLRKFLREYAVDRGLVIKIMQQLNDRMHAKERIHYNDVTVLEMLSSGLRKELRHAMHRDSMTTHALFRLWEALDPMALQVLCCEAIETMFLRVHDDLFVSASPAEGAYHIRSGSLDYSQDAESAPVDVGHPAMFVSSKQWVSTAALCVEWIHVGNMVAITWSEVLKVNPSLVWSCCMKHHVIKDITIQYVMRFHANLTTARIPSNDFPSDIEVPHTEFGELVHGMPKELTQIICKATFENIDTHWFRHTGRSLERLREEIRIGRSIVVTEGSGDVTRVVSVVAVRIKRCDGAILMQIGVREGVAWNESLRNHSASGLRVVPRLQIPGKAMLREDTPRNMLNKILQLRLQPLSEAVKVDNWKREDHEEDSQRTGLRTTYLRYVCNMTLTKNFEVRVLDSSPLPEGYSTRTVTSAAGWALSRSRVVYNSRTSSSLSFTQAQIEDRCWWLRKDVFAIRDHFKDDRIVLYAFLQPHEVASLTDAQLEQWTNSLRPEDKLASCIVVTTDDMLDAALTDDGDRTEVFDL